MTASDRPRIRGRAARHQILVEWNDTAAPGSRPPESGFAELFAARAAKTPDAVAVQTGDEHLTYRQIERASRRLAGALRRRGAGGETRIGLLHERAPAMVVGAVGILRAPATYVPLDPQYPAARIRWLIEDAGITHVVTRRGLRSLLPAGKELTVVCLDSALSARGTPGRGTPSRDTLAAADPLAGAYLIYTSGSTGEPKGVTVAQKALAWYCLTAATHYRLRPGDRLLQLASIGFDISIGEIFPGLAAGATLVLPGAAARPDADFLTRCREQAVTVLFPATALWHELAELAELQPDAVPATLRLVSFGGERLLAPRLAAWRRAVGPGIRRAGGPGIRLVNGYGPTETTVEATLCDLTAPGAADAALIGRPVAGARVYVLDERLQPAAPGLAGELAVGGSGLARGYQGRPAATARRFVPDPFAREPGSRLYLTGDRVRWRTTGRLEILGRFDRQLKIRGFRVEPGEIEAALTRHPDVRDAAVVARGDGSRRHLVAWIVAGRPTAAAASGGSTEGGGILGVGDGDAGDRARAAPEAGELRRFLARSLPAHMVPAAFELVERLPLSANGKIDRRALELAPERHGCAPAEPAPRTGPARRPAGESTEQKLARIWAEVLRLERVGIDDDFFELGGDSILAIQIVTRAYREGMRLASGDVFENPTVARLAAAAGPVSPSAAHRRSRGPARGCAPLTPVQCWFFHEASFPEPRHFNQSMLLAVRRPLDPAVLERTVEVLLRHHDALRARFEPAPGGWRQRFPRFQPGAPVVRIDLSRLLDGATSRRQLTAAAAGVQASLDPERGPLLRFAYFELGGRAPRLLVAVHHLVIDAVSWSILLGDLERVYRRLERGRPASLPPRTTSYQAWARFQSWHARSPTLAAELGHWRSQAGAAGAVPLDFPGGANTLRSAATVSVSLSREATARLLRRVPAAYRTRIDDVLLTALAGALTPWTGAVTIDLESHGREELAAGLDFSRTVGWFTSTFPVRLDLGGVDEPGEALMTVKETLRAVPRNGIGYGILRYLGSDEKPGHRLPPGTAEVSFNYLGQLDALFADSELFTPAGEARGPEAGRRGGRAYVLEIDGGIVRDRLWIHWHFSRNLHRRATVERLAASFRRRLEALITHCLSPGAGGVTPSDFPLARLDRRRLDRLAGDRFATSRDLEDVYPLSPMQQGMLFHTLYAPRSAVYFEQSSWALAGDLDTPALRRAWERLAARHPILRTSFAWQGLERPLQVVHRRVEVPWRFEDRSGGTSVEQEAELAELLRRDRARPFDLARAPLLRLALIRLGPDRHRLLWSVHHLLLDGWSIAALFDELFSCYDALRRGREPRLPARRPPRDFIAWLESRDPGAAETFWRRELAGFAAPTPVVAAAGAAAGAGAGGEMAAREAVEVRRRLEAGPTAALGALARELRTTLATVFQGAWALALARLCGERDVVFGATVSGRPAELPGADSIVGLLINTLPVRVRVEPRRRLAPWLARLHASALEMRRVEHSPLVEIQAWSEVPPHLPLFESLLVFENYPTDVALEAEQRRGGLDVADFRGYSQTNYPLTLGVLPGPELVLEASVDPDRFGPTAAARLLRRLEVLLAGMAEGPDRALHELPFLSAAESHQVLVEWSARPADASRKPPARAGTVDRLLADRAAETPDAAALVWEGADGSSHTLSYAGLSRAAGRLARALRARGVTVESRVGLAVERPEDAVTAILAVLRAGGAYVPLDPSHPRRRWRGILARAGVELLVTRGDSPSPLPIPVLDLDRPDPAAARRGGAGLDAGREAAPGNLAYVLHTSGSTGAPKGVMVTHGALTATLDGWRRDYRLPRTARRHLQMASFTFDVASGDLLRALGTGGTLVLCPRGLPPTPRQLADRMRRERVDCAELVPAVADLLAQHLEASGSALPHLRLLAVGSDSWRMRDLRRLERALGRRARVVDSYGVTEAAVDSTFFDPRAGALARRLGGDRPVPIGRPFAGEKAYVLDRRREAAGAGVPGELALAGDGLARGYAGRPAATAERFLPDPFAAIPGARLYRTGDLVRFLPDGNLEHLGRVDHQLKIRGHRVEPGEVEAVLGRHPAVASAVVGGRGDASGERILTAWVVPDRASGCPAEGLRAELRRFLAERLPPPMVPSTFVVLDDLPLNRHGKIDRLALARDADLAGESPGDPAKEAPATPIEKALAEIWSRILGVASVGRGDDFFGLGGHSLRAVRLMVDVEHRFGVRLPLATLFRHSALRDLARRIERPGAGAGERRPLVEIARGNGNPPFFCVHPVGGNVLCYAELARRLGADQPFYGLQAPGPDEPRPADVAGLADHYLEALRGAPCRGPWLLGGWSMGGLVAFEMARRLRRSGEEVAALTLIDVAVPGSPSSAGIDEVASLQAFAADLGLTDAGEGPANGQPETRALRRILTRARRRGILGGDVGFADLERLYRLFELNDRAMKRYRPRPFDGRLTLVRSAQWRGDPTLGWATLARRVDVRVVGGDHWTMVREPHVERLAAVLREEIERASARPADPRRVMLGSSTVPGPTRKSGTRPEPEER